MTFKTSHNNDDGKFHCRWHQSCTCNQNWEKICAMCLQPIPQWHDQQLQYPSCGYAEPEQTLTDTNTKQILIIKH